MRVYVRVDNRVLFWTRSGSGLTDETTGKTALMLPLRTLSGKKKEKKDM